MTAPVPPPTDEQIAEVVQNRLEQTQRAYKVVDPSLPWAIRFYLEDMPHVLEALRAAREELMSARAERVELIAERDRAKAAERQRALGILQIAYDALPHDSHWEAAGAALYNVQRRIRAVEEGADRG